MGENHKVFKGLCTVCDLRTTFVMREDRIFYRSMQCENCGSWPAQRAFFYALNNVRPNWRNLHIHESSPGDGAASIKIMRECSSYTPSHYDPSKQAGSLIRDETMPCKEYYVQNLEDQTFESGKFDIVVALEVFEHVMHPYQAIREIARTLKPGGTAILAVPVVNKFQPSRRRAKLVEGIIEHVLPAEYHGNPVGDGGALVTVDWGYDIVSHFSAASSMHFTMQTFENMDFGIRDEFNQILVGTKSPLPELC